jgi:hypothetical protein
VTYLRHFDGTLKTSTNKWRDLRSFSVLWSRSRVEFAVHFTTTDPGFLAI